MKLTLQILRLGLLAALLVIPPDLLATPPHTGIRGHAVLYRAGSFVEVAPGLWLGHGGFALPTTTSFTVLSTHSGREVGYFATDADGTFEITLPPGEYVLAPDALFESLGCALPITPFEVTVKPKQFTDVLLWYYQDEPCSITLTAWP